jgi:hypothetical protein
VAAATSSGQTDLVDIYCPYVEGMLSPVTAMCLSDLIGWRPTLVRMRAGKPYDYPEAFSRWWERGHTFLVVEHDMVFSEARVNAMGACLAPWCVQAYPCFGVTVTTGLGFTRFSERLIRSIPDLPARIAMSGAMRPERTEWWQLDQEVARVLTAYGHSPHVHPGQVGHLHDYPAQLTRP